MVIPTKEIWFSPINVLFHFARLEALLDQSKKKSRSFRKAEEAYFTAIMLMGIIKHQSKEYWMQIVEDDEGTPDIRTATFELTKGKPKELMIQEVEVVDFGINSPEDIVSFIKNKKLSKNYPEYINILCRVSKNTNLPPYKDIHSKLQNEKQKNPVIILGKISSSNQVYRICQVHPTVDLLQDFDVMKESYNKKFRGVLRLKKGSNEKLDFIYYPTEKHYPFETLGLE